MAMKASGEAEKLLSLIDESILYKLDKLVSMDSQNNIYRLQGAVAALNEIRDIIHDPQMIVERIQGE